MMKKASSKHRNNRINKKVLLIEKKCLNTGVTPVQ